MKICVFGSGSDLIDKKYVDEAFDLGATLAACGHSLVFGGGTRSVMGASARGFKSAGGKVIGVTPKFFYDQSPEVLFGECDESVVTQTMHERKQCMEGISDAFIIAPGGAGTFDEFFTVLTTKKLGRHDKPIVVFNCFGFYDELLAAIIRATDEGFIEADCEKLYAVLDDAEKIAAYLASDAPYEYLKK